MLENVTASVCQSGMTQYTYPLPASFGRASYAARSTSAFNTAVQVAAGLLVVLRHTRPSFTGLFS